MQPETEVSERSAARPRRLKVLTWHVHGNYLYYLSQVPHDFHLVTKPGYPPGYAGVGGNLPWGDNLREVPADEVRRHEFDCVLYQSRQNWLVDRFELLSPAQQKLPRIYLEHDPPQQHPTDTRHWVDDPHALLVHVTPFNALMWDSGEVPVRVIEHGVVVPPGVTYRGERLQGIAVVNHLKRRGRRLGADLFAQLREQVPLELVGMDAPLAGGFGEIPNDRLAAYIAHYRFFFHPVRYTSLGLAVIEAMMIGMPVVGLATTELATVIRSGINGYVDTRPAVLADVMHSLIRDPALARSWGDAAAATARHRFAIERFVADWNAALALVTE